MPEPAATDGPIRVEVVDGLPVRLRAPHDLSFLVRWGRVFRVFDDQDSGNVCFGVGGPGGRVFVKYAGATTVRGAGGVRDAIHVLSRAADVYEALRHPTLVVLREALPVGAGHALVFDWVEGISAGRQFGGPERLRALTVAQRTRAVREIYDFHRFAAERGWAAVDLYDASVMLDPHTGRVTLCDLDFYRPAPSVNEMGRMWGSSRFMSPEEYERGAPIDEVTNVFALGALAHTLLGDDGTKSRDAWVGTPAQFDVAARALRPDRAVRWPSVAALADAWEAAGGA